MKLFSFILWFLTWININCQAATTLKQIYLYALQHSPQLESATREIKIASYDRAIAEKNFWPRLSLATNHGLQDPHPFGYTIKPPWVSSWGLVLNELLYDYGQSDTSRTITELREKQRKLSLEKSRESLGRDLAKTYYRYCLQTKQMEFEKKRKKFLQKQFQYVSRAYYGGEKTLKDFVRMKVQITRSDISLLQSESVVSNALLDVWRLAGGRVNDISDLVIDETELDLDEIPTINTPVSLKWFQEINKLDEDIAIQEMNLAKLKNSPQISLQFAIGYGNSNYLIESRSLLNGAALNWSLLLDFRMDLWDWGQSKWREQSFEEKRWQALTQKNLADNEIQRQLRTLFIELDRLKKTVEKSKDLLLEEENNLKILDGEYRRGQVNYIDFINSLKDFFDAQLNHYSLFYEVKQNIVDYWFFQNKVHDKLISQ